MHWLMVALDHTQWHKHPPHLAGILCRNDQPDADISTWQHITLTTDRPLCLR